MTYASSHAIYSNRLIDAKPDSRWYQLSLVMLGVIVMIVCSQIDVPLPVVPITLQTVGVVLLGVALGPQLATYSMLTYVFLGAIGVPVFADWHFGLTTLLGPSGGYIMGFVPATFVAGWLMQRGFAKNILLSWVAAMASIAVIYAFGLSLLTVYVGWHQALTFGVYPFIIPGAIKMVALAILAPRLWRAN